MGKWIEPALAMMAMGALVLGIVQSHKYDRGQFAPMWAVILLCAGFQALVLVLFVTDRITGEQKAEWLNIIRPFAFVFVYALPPMLSTVRVRGLRKNVK